MDLKLVDYLLLAAETGSFAKAASKIGMAQPTFGRLIARLEKDCGARLLYRHGRGVRFFPKLRYFGVRCKGSAVRVAM